MRGQQALMRAGAGLLITAMLVQLGACGWRLRGTQIDVDMPPVHVEGTAPDPKLRLMLREALLQAGAAVSETPDGADVILEVMDIASDRRMLTRAADGTVGEYQLHYAVRFQVRERDGGILLGPTAIAKQRAYTYDDPDVVAKDQEQALLLNDLRREVITAMLRRLRSLFAKR